MLEWTYNSNAIEGNTLTLIETKVVLEGITVGGKTLREHLEVINHKDAILYIEDIVRNDEEFSEWQIKNIHRLVLKGIDDYYAGNYRNARFSNLRNEHYFLSQVTISDLVIFYTFEINHSIYLSFPDNSPKVPRAYLELQFFPPSVRLYYQLFEGLSFY